jgi:hypothetical protein
MFIVVFLPYPFAFSGNLKTPPKSVECVTELPNDMLCPLAVKSNHVDPEPGYERYDPASTAITNPSLTTKGPW